MQPNTPAACSWILLVPWQLLTPVAVLVVFDGFMQRVLGACILRQRLIAATVRITFSRLVQEYTADSK